MNSKPVSSNLMQLESLDHLVLTVRDIAATVAWYERVLGMQSVTFGEGRIALVFGSQKINLHTAGNEIAPHAAAPTPGSADLCFLTTVPLAEVGVHLAKCGVIVESGPVVRTGARKPLLSLYVRDPDNNLLEISNEQITTTP